MMIKLIFVLFTIFSLATARTNSPSKPQNKIQTAFQRSKLVPDILSYPVCVPSQLLQVKYGRKEVNLGNAFTLAEVKNGPQVQWKADSKALYTLAMVDPDAPSPKDFPLREYRHWLVVNIQGNNWKSGNVVSSYVGAGAPPKTGFHRYVFLLYKQNGRLNASKIDQERTKFHIEKFANANNLGRAIAGNYYLAQNDEQ